MVTVAQVREYMSTLGRGHSKHEGPEEVWERAVGYRSYRTLYTLEKTCFVSTEHF